MTSTVAAIILAATLTHAVSAVSLGGTQPGGGGTGGKSQPEPKLIPMTAARVFTDARDALRTGPLAQRLTVTVIHKGRTPSSANVLLRTAPGKERDQRDAKVSIEAGDLRVYAEGGHVTAAIASNPTTYYRADIDGPPTLAALSKALHPLPIPELAIFFADGDAVKDPTPLTRGITWNPITRSVDEPTAPITLTGTVEGREGQATMVLEYQSVQRDKHKESLLRMRSFTCPLAAPSGEERSISVTSAWTDPGDPASWKFDVATRTRVDSLAALGIKVEPPPAPTPPATTTPLPPAAPAPAAPAPAEPKKPEEPAPKADPTTSPKPE